jgi:biopolymer transport protein ExbD
MFGKTRRSPPEQVEPDLPITPMLDMSFQLMAFFIFTFRPAPTEGQIAMSLPKEEGGQTSFSIPSIDDDKPVKEVVKVQAADNGNIADITAAPETGSFSLGQDTSKLFAYLKEKAAGDKTPKLKFEIAERLNYQYVIKLIDEARRAGFTRISPALLNPPGAPK